MYWISKFNDSEQQLQVSKSTMNRLQKAIDKAINEHNNNVLKNKSTKQIKNRYVSTYHEDFVDEDTGEVVSIERNETVANNKSLVDRHGDKLALVIKVDLTVEEAYLFDNQEISVCTYKNAKKLFNKR